MRYNIMHDKTIYRNQNHSHFNIHLNTFTYWYIFTRINSCLNRMIVLPVIYTCIMIVKQEARFPLTVQHALAVVGIFCTWLQRLLHLSQSCAAWLFWLHPLVFYPLGLVAASQALYTGLTLERYVGRGFLCDMFNTWCIQ